VGQNHRARVRRRIVQLPLGFAANRIALAGPVLRSVSSGSSRALYPVAWLYWMSATRADVAA